MIAAALLLTTLSCPRPLTLKQAERLVLAAPNIQASVRERGAKPYFEWIHNTGRGWQFDINSRTPCDHVPACSTLLGHYTVGKYDAKVVDLDAGEDGLEVTSSDMLALKRSFAGKSCRSHLGHRE
jgi:hypothetical protein